MSGRKETNEFETKQSSVLGLPFKALKEKLKL